jgi:imidazolonepropionase-like amidohydrolase
MLQFLGAMRRADGVAEVRRAARANLAAGAHFIKVLGGGGVSSPFDPLESVQCTLDELKAAAEEAEHYGTYATIHVHLDKAVNRALDAGFKMLEHATVMEEDTVKRLADEGIIWCMQTALFLPDPYTNPAFSNDVQRAKAKVVQEGMTKSIEWAQKYGVITLWGTDLIGSRKGFLEYFPKEWEYRNKFYTAAEQLKQVTSLGGKGVALSGLKNPYAEGPLGVIEPGAYADILLVDGNPLNDILILQNYEENIDLIMKDGLVYKDCISTSGGHNV